MARVIDLVLRDSANSTFLKYEIRVRGKILMRPILDDFLEKKFNWIAVMGGKG